MESPALLPPPPADVAALTSPKIFVATPTHICKRYCAERFVKAIQAHIIEPFPGSSAIIANNSKATLTTDFYYHKSRPAISAINLHMDQSHFGEADSIHKRIVKTVNFLRDTFLRNCEAQGWTHYLSLEADVLVAEDTVRRMLDRAAPVVAANCYRGFFKEKEYCRVERLTMGCTLIERDIVKLIPFRYDPSLLKAHYDALFAHDCVAAGVPMYYDPSIRCEHMHDNASDRGWKQLPFSERRAT